MSLPSKALTDNSDLYSELEALPEHLVGEIVNGQLFEHPRPSGLHGVAASTLGSDIHQSFHRGRGGPGGWWILDEPELHLNGDVVVPDIAGWRRTTMPDIPTDHRFVVPPDWICEVLSPSNASHDRIVKMPIYANAGIKHVWVVDPLMKTQEVFELHNQRWTLHSGYKDDDEIKAPPFEEVSFELAALWHTSSNQSPAG